MALAITELFAGLLTFYPQLTILKTGAFTVDETDGFDVFYFQSSPGTITLPASPTFGYRFSVTASSTSTFALNGNSTNLPGGKTLAPNSDNATIGFVANGLNNINVFGDLADA